MPRRTRDDKTDLLVAVALIVVAVGLAVVIILTLLTLNSVFLGE